MLSDTVETDYLKILPHSRGFLINDIPATLANVTRNDYRVDLMLGDKAAFLVEHVLGCLLLAGVTSAKVYGTATKYDLSRQSFKDALKLGLPPSSVIGNPYGTLDTKLYNKLVDATVEDKERAKVGIAREAEFSSPYGTIKVSPSDEFEVCVSHGKLLYEFSFEEEKIMEVVRARTPYLDGLDERTIPHVVGDVVADIWGMGGINCAKIEIIPRREYHRITIDILRKI
ncbi:MAG: hypothetical protein V3T58_00370 [Candidatus Hydrothermarchaeales archaeon]